MKKKVLMITSPNRTVRQYGNFIYPYLGTAEIAGSLIHHGFDVDYYDLNARLNKMRGSTELTELDEETLDILSTKLKTEEKIYDNDNLILNKWLKELVDLLPNENYHAIGISIPETYRWKNPNKERPHLLNIAVLLSFHLNKKYENTPIYIGGQSALQLVPQDVFLRTLTAMTPITAIFMTNAKASFPKLLQRERNADDLFTPMLYEKTRVMSIPELLKIPPYWDIKNKDDLLLDVVRVIPKNVIEKHPEINNITPYGIRPYNFSEGCVHRCAFCIHGQFNFFKRLKIVEIVNFLEKTIDDGINCFGFFNTSITFSEKFAIEFSNEIIRRNLNIFFSDSANLNTITKEVVTALFEAGCIKLWYGGETPNQRLLDLNNKKLTVEQIYKGLQLSHEAGIWNCINTIVSFPNETEEEFIKTKNLCHHEHVDAFRCNIFNAYSVSDYARYPEKFGIKIKSMTFNEVSKRKMFAYDDLTLKWEDKIADGKRKRSEVYSSDYAENSIMMNDALLYGISQITKNKNKKRSIFRDIINSFDKEALKEYNNRIEV